MKLQKYLFFMVALELFRGKKSAASCGIRSTYQITQSNGCDAIEVENCWNQLDQRYKNKKYVNGYKRIRVPVGWRIVYIFFFLHWWSHSLRWRWNLQYCTRNVNDDDALKSHYFVSLVCHQFLKRSMSNAKCLYVDLYATTCSLFVISTKRHTAFRGYRLSQHAVCTYQMFDSGFWFEIKKKVHVIINGGHIDCCASLFAMIQL